MLKENAEKLIAKWTRKLKKISKDFDAVEGVPKPVAWAIAETLDNCITELKQIVKE